MVLNRHFLWPFYDSNDTFFPHVFATISSDTFRVFLLRIVFLNSVLNSINIVSIVLTLDAMNYKNLSIRIIIFIHPSNKINTWAVSETSVDSSRAKEYHCRFLSDNWINIFSEITSTLQASVCRQTDVFIYVLYSSCVIFRNSYQKYDFQNN